MTSITIHSTFDLSPLDQANKQILVEIDNSEQQIKEEIFLAGEQVGEIIGIQKATKGILTYNTGELLGDIALLSKMQARELKTLANSWEAKNRLICEKLGAMVFAVEKYTKKSKQKHCGALKLDVIPTLQDVIDSIPSIDIRFFRKLLPNKPGHFYKLPQPSGI